MYEMDEISKRTLFAMAALQGLLAGPTMMRSADIAKFSYQLADDMMLEDMKPWDGKSIAERKAEELAEKEQENVPAPA